MSTTWQSDVGRLRRAVVKHPHDAFGGPESVEAQWEGLGYLASPDPSLAVEEFDVFSRLLEGLGVELLFLPQVEDVGMDSIYARDAALVTDAGVILCRMGKSARGGEPSAQALAYSQWGIPVLGSIGGEGRLEGGDVVWLDENTLAIGQGYRTNAEGISRLTALLDPTIEVVTVPLPHFRGPGDVFHLMSMLSPVDRDLALVYSPLMSVPFRDLLLARGYTLVEVPEEEYDTLGCNVLTVAPRVCVMAEGSPETRRRMEAAGVAVHTFSGGEICLKGSGGPTCLTRTLERDR